MTIVQRKADTVILTDTEWIKSKKMQGIKRDQRIHTNKKRITFM